MRTSPRWRGALASAASAALLVALPLMGAQTAYAQPTACMAYADSLCLSISPVTVEPGQTVTFSASGFDPGQTVTAELCPEKKNGHKAKPRSHDGTNKKECIFLGTFTADSEGVVTGTVTIPQNTKPGDYLFQLTSSDPKRTVCASIKVLGEEGEPGQDEHGKHNEHGKPHEHGKSDGRRGPDSHSGSGGQGHHRNVPSLARTGSEALALGGTAAGLVAGGGAMMAVRRRRRS